MPDTSRPLLFFDSGIGGLSVLRATQKLLPTAPVVYAADYAGLPYGEKSEREIEGRVPALLGRLIERYHPALVTIACNTASTIALSAVRSALDIPVVGTVPAIKPAAAMTQTGVIGLLGTAATIRQPYVDRLMTDHGGDTLLLRHAAPVLVEAAEAKYRGEPIVSVILAEAIAGLRDQPSGERIDTVILACTHFPLLRDELAELWPGVRFVDGAEGIARRIACLTRGIAWPIDASPGLFVTTGGTEAMAAYRDTLREYDLDTIETL